MAGPRIGGGQVAEDVLVVDPVLRDHRNRFLALFDPLLPLGGICQAIAKVGLPAARIVIVGAQAKRSVDVGYAIRAAPEIDLVEAGARVRIGVATVVLNRDLRLYERLRPLLFKGKNPSLREMRPGIVGLNRQDGINQFIGACDVFQIVLAPTSIDTQGQGSR